MRKFPCWRLPMNFWRIARLLLCDSVACPPLLLVLAAAAGDAVFLANTPGPCSLLLHTSRTTAMTGWITMDCLAPLAPPMRFRIDIDDRSRRMGMKS